MIYFGRRIKVKKFKKIVDERQILEMYKIEHIGFWIMWTILLVNISVQTFLMDVPFSQISPELIAFMVGDIVIVIGSIKKGFWSYYSNPSMKSYLFYSITGTAIFSFLYAISMYNENEYLHDNMIALIIISSVIAAFIFGFLFIIMVISGEMIIRKRNKAEKEYDDDQEK